MAKFVLAGAVVALSLVLPALPASAIVRCTTADGKTMFVDVPPTGCTVERAYESAPRAADAPAAPSTGTPGVAPAPSDANETTRRAFARRTDLERDIKQAEADRQTAMRERTGLVYPSPPSGGSPAEIEAHRSRVAEIGATRERLERDLEDLVVRIGRYREEFATLTAEVMKANDGRLPPSWAPALDCPGCP